MNFTKTFVAAAFTLQLFSLTACEDTPSKANDAGSNPSDSLNGKVWYVIGDSFSIGEWSGVSATPSIQEGKYKGKQPVYSYLIGNRTGMDVYNIAVIGSTLSIYSGSNEKNSFTHPQGLLYTTDFSRADYITIYYGINDSNLDVPIGVIDDTDPATFYGAYNTTLDYLTKHYPKAKIGLIVSNACASRDFPDATAAVAEKWGLPYLDLDGGINCPTMLLCSSRNPASEEEKTEALIQQRISTTNYHPNEFAHQLESEYIEKWLRSF